MLKLLTIAVLIGVASSAMIWDQPNKIWERTDEVVIYFDILYDNLAHTVADSSNKQKRAFSIMLVGYFEFMVSGGNTSVTVDVSKPADIFSAETRSGFDLFRLAVDPAINVVKRACPPKATVKECTKALASEEQKQKEACDGYSAHKKFLKQTEDLVNNKEYQSVINEILQLSKKADDKTALEYLEKLKQRKIYKSTTSKLIKWYSSYAHGDFPCNLPPGACQANNSDSSKECD